MAEMLPVVALVSVLGTLLWLSSGGMTVAPLKQTLMESFRKAECLKQLNVLMSHKVLIFVLRIQYIFNTNQDCYWARNQS